MSSAAGTGSVHPISAHLACYYNSKLHAFAVNASLELGITAVCKAIRSSVPFTEDNDLRTLSRILNRLPPWLALDVLGHGGVACCAVRAAEGDKDVSEQLVRARVVFCLLPGEANAIKSKDEISRFMNMKDWEYFNEFPAWRGFYR